MKKILLSAIALFALVFAGCNKSELDPVKESTYTHIIKASINDFGTKTTMYGNTVNWEKGDRIALFTSDGTKILYELVEETAGTCEGDFGTSANVDDKTFVAALYPYDENASYSDGVITTNVAKDYTWAEGKNNKALMATNNITDPNFISFKNAGAVIVLTVNNIPAGYNKIQLTGANTINGTTQISFEEDGPVSATVATKEENRTTTIKFDKSVATTNKVFYIPMSVTAVADIKVTLAGGSEPLQLLSKNTSIKRNCRYYKTINFDGNGNLPVKTATAKELNSKIAEGTTNFILDDSITELEISESTVEELQIAVTTSATSFTLKGEGAKGKIILCTPDNIQSLNIDTPNATVELKPDTGVDNITSVTARTAENTLVIPVGTTVANLTVIGGNVRVFGTVGNITNPTGSQIIIYKEKGAAIPAELATDLFKVLDYTSDIFVSTKEDLFAAVENAKAGDVIYIGSDINIGETTLVINKAITLDGGNHTITHTLATTNGRCINVRDAAEEIVIRNLNIVAMGERAINVIKSAKKVRIENVKAAAANYCVNVAGSAPGVSITIKNSDLTGLNTVNIAGANTTVDITYTRLFCNDNNSSENYAAIAINPEVTGSKVTVKGGILVVNGESWGGSVADGSITFEDTKGNTNIKQVSFVINYGNNSYSFITFEEALAKHVNGETIIVTHDYVQPDKITIPADKEVILDLNGHTLSQEKAQTAAYAMIVNKGTLTIKDSSPDYSGKVSYKDITNYSADNNYASNTIRNDGTFTLISGTIENISSDNVMTNGYPHAIDVYPGSTTNIEGGTVKSANYDCIRMFCNSTTVATTVNISGGNIINRVTFQNPSSNQAGYGRLNITGGVFTTIGNVNANVRLLNFSSDVSNMKAKISGGRFDKGVKINNYSSWSANWDWLEISNNAINKL